MPEEKLKQLKEILKAMGRVVVAFSGGVDSTFLLKVALDVLGRDNVLAVTADSPTYQRRELQLAREMAAHLGVRHLVIRTEEMKDPAFWTNPPERCYYCKRELMTRLKDIAARYGIPYVVEGSNADDVGDYRPGRRALAELGIRSPLLEAGLTKDEIRELSHRMGLPTWDKPPVACLASRVPFGQPITLEKLQRVEKAESALMDMGFRLIRVRDHGSLARIETSPQEMDRLWEQRDKVVEAVKKAGYRFITVDLEGYRPAGLSFGRGQDVPGRTA